MQCEIGLPARNIRRPARPSWPGRFGRSTGLSVGFDPIAVGNFSGTVTLHPTSGNASGSSAMGDISLFLHANVTGQVGVPEPSGLLLLVSGLAGIGVLRRRFRS